MVGVDCAVGAGPRGQPRRHLRIDGVAVLPPARLALMIGRRQLFVWAAAWTAFAVYGSLVPLHYRATSLASALERMRALPAPTIGIGTGADWGTNVLLFIPLTFLWMGFLTLNASTTIRLFASVLCIPVAACFAVAIEFAQIWFPPRTVSINDMTAEAIGGVVGVAG